MDTTIIQSFFEGFCAPEADPGYMPIELFFCGYEKLIGAQDTRRVILALERENGLIARHELRVSMDAGLMGVTLLYVERFIKTLLWIKSGFRLHLCAPELVAEHISNTYCRGGRRSFDVEFMERVYDRPFEIVSCLEADAPLQKEASLPMGGFTGGCRIGLDAGGSDRKVAAVRDGEVLYDEEIVWFPKAKANPEYHFAHIVEALRTAAAYLPRVDAIGISSPGVYVGNRTMIASLFLRVGEKDFEERVKNIFIDAAKELGVTNLVVANGGDVAALAGSMELGAGRLMGIALGTSQAGGYVDANKCITGWMNGLAFAPVDVNPAAMMDEWSGDRGCGAKYFSQDGAIRLAQNAGIWLDGGLSLAEKLKQIQIYMAEGSKRARKVYEAIGTYIAYTIKWYLRFYDAAHFMLMGRVMSGQGGNLALETAIKTLEDIGVAGVSLFLPDESKRRVGTAVAAASLPPPER